PSTSAPRRHLLFQFLQALLEVGDEGFEPLDGVAHLVVFVARVARRLDGRGQGVRERRQVRIGGNELRVGADAGLGGLLQRGENRRVVVRHYDATQSFSCVRISARMETPSRFALSCTSRQRPAGIAARRYCLPLSPWGRNAFEYPRFGFMIASPS